MRGWGAVACAGIAGCLAIGTLVATPTSAATVTVVMTGTLTRVSGPSGVTDGSLQVGAPFALTMTFSDAVSDLDPDGSLGDFRVPALSSSYVVSTGNYVFSANGDLAISIEDDNAFGEDVLAWFVDDFAVFGALPTGVGPGAVTFSSVQLTDSTATAHSSDRLTDLAWDRAAYGPDNFAFWLAVQLAGPGIGPQQGIELLGTIEALSVVPEPNRLLLVAAGLAWIGLSLRRKRSC